jgi:xylulokinase
MDNMSNADLLAIDLGTQSIRLTAFDRTGQKQWNWSALVDSHIQGDIFEQSTEQWGTLLLQGLCEARLAGIRPKAIAAAGLLAGYVALDSEGHALCPAVMYTDRRSAPEAKFVEAIALVQPDDSGLRVHIADPIPQWLRLCREFPDVAEKTTYFLDATGWINFFLTGQATVNAFTGLRLYTSETQRLLGLKNTPFGKITPLGQAIGTLRPSIAQALGVDNAQVISATFDSKCAYLGSGLSRPGQATEISGTVSSLGVLSNKHIQDKTRRIYSVPFINSYLVRGSTAAAGSSLEWAMQNLLHCNLAGLDVLLAQSTPGANGICFLPYLAGERTPLWNPWASGSLLGLKLESSKSDIARAVMEGLAFSVGHVATVFAECGVRMDEVFLAGGLARNNLLCQIKADIWNVHVKTFRDHELTSIGLGAIMAVAMGYFRDMPEAASAFTHIEKKFIPNANTQNLHNDAFKKYQEYSQALAPLYVPTK